MNNIVFNIASKADIPFIDETDTTMTEEFEKEHQWELSRNCFINKVTNYINSMDIFK